MTRKQILSSLIAIAAIIVLAIAYFVYTSGSGDGIPQEGTKFAIVLSPRDKTLGSPKAPIQVVEYAAPSCPHCAHWNEDVFPTLKKEYIDTGKVYYVFRVFPLSSLDVAVESMARCLPADSYFQFIDMMYREQARWDPDGNTVPDVHAALVQMGRIAGMSEDQVNNCISPSNADEQAKISQVGQYAAKTYNIDSTPTFIVDGRITPLAVTSSGLRDVLNGLLAKKP
ncbi:MAG: DsbA family protein [Pseudomonadota bacterium]|nr:DsbA family protein [Pseudomonadota bacterium]